MKNAIKNIAITFTFAIATFGVINTADASFQKEIQDIQKERSISQLGQTNCGESKNKKKNESSEKESQLAANTNASRFL